MQGAGRKRRASAGAGSKAQQGSKKQKRSKSDAAALPATKKRRSAPEPPKGSGPGHATPYNLRTRSSMPAAGTVATGTTDNSQPSSAPTKGLPSSVRPRNPNTKATWNELPAEVLKVICQQLDASSVLSARSVTAGMRDACSGVPVQLRFTLPMQSSPWMPVQLEAWDRRINGVAGLLGNGKMRSSELQLRMEGAAVWKGEESMPLSMIHSTIQRLMPLLQPLRKLGSVAASPITHLDAELPLSVETLAVLSTALPGVTSLRLDNLIPPPQNHVQIMSDIRVFPDVRKLDLAVTAWDQVQHLAPLTQLTELKLRYCMWNIPELTPLASLQQLHTFSIEVLDDRARFQLDFLGPLVRGLPRLRHLRASLILSRTVVSEGGPASCDFLSGCGLQTLELDVRAPQDAARTVHVHFRNLHLAPQSCKVRLTIRADALTRETSFESAATRNATIIAPRLGMANPSPPEPRERWGALNLPELGGHPPGALSLLHLRGYHVPLTTLPDLSAARLTRLQISNARLCPADFTALAGCTSLEHLFVRFMYASDTSTSTGANHGTGAAVCEGGGANVPKGPTGSASTSGSGEDTSEAALFGYVGGFKARVAAAGCHSMLTRSRKSLLGNGRQSIGATGGSAGGGRPSTGAAGGRAALPAVTTPVVAADCTVSPVPYVLQPLLQLRRLHSLELLEEGDPEGATVTSTPTANGVGSSTGHALATTTAAAVGPSGAGAGRGVAAAKGSAAAGSAAAHGGARQHRGGTKAATAAAAAAAAVGGAAAASQHHQQHHHKTRRLPSLPMSRSALTHFLQHLSRAQQLTHLSISLLADESSLPDCPCKTSCFTSAASSGTKGTKEASLRPLRPETIAELLLVSGAAAAAAASRSKERRYKVVLGSLTAESACWYRPSAWPALDD